MIIAPVDVGTLGVLRARMQAFLRQGKGKEMKTNTVRNGDILEEALKIEKKRIADVLKNRKPRRVAPAVTKKRLELLARVLLRLRWDEQGGFVSRNKRGWDFVTGGLPQVTPKEMDELFKLAGVVPDEIISAGPCSGCAFSLDGRERGYDHPCGGCKRPLHSRFKPKTEGA